MNAAEFAVYSRREWRAPVFRFPAAHYETLPESLSYDGSNRTILQYDKSGNSAVNCLVLNGVAGNYASLVDAAAFNPAGNFAGFLELSCTDATPAAQMRLFSHNGGAGNRAVYFAINTNGSFEVLVSYDGTNVLTFTTTATAILADFEKKYVGFEVDVDNGAGGSICTFYTSTNGTSWTAVEAGKTIAGTGTLFDSTSIFSIGANDAGAGTFGGNICKLSWLSGDLATGTPMLAVDFSTFTKLAGTGTATTGQTVTINTTGATGARISGARDLFNGVAASQPILTIAATGNYLTFDGSNDYLKAAAFALGQPVSIYGVLNQLTWTINDILLDGNTNGSMQLYQSVTTPSLQQYSGGGGAASSGLALNTNGVVTSIVNGAASFLRINRAAAATGNPGAGTPNGFTLGAAGNGASPANITVSEVLVYPAAHDEIAQQRMARETMRRMRIPMAA